jgi:hypothetical protein
MVGLCLEMQTASFKRKLTWSSVSNDFDGQGHVGRG